MGKVWLHRVLKVAASDHDIFVGIVCRLTQRIDLAGLKPSSQAF